MTGGSSITSPFHPPQQLASCDDDAAGTTVTVQAGLKVSDDEMLDFDNMVQFTEHFKEIPCCVLNMGVVSYPAIKAQWPEIVKSVHDYSLQRTKHAYSFNVMFEMFGLHSIDSEIECEEWIFANLGGLCMASEKKHELQLRLVLRVMINAWLTYFCAPKQYWKEYPQGEAVVDADEAVNKSSMSDSELI